MDVAKTLADELDKLPEPLRSGTLAAAASVLAELLPESSPRDAAAISRELRQTLAELRDLAAKQKPAEVDPVDELDARRRARLSSGVPDGAAGAAGRR